MTVKGQQLIQLATTAAAGLVKMQAESATVKSINHMKVLSFALLAYARDHNGSFPATLEELGRLHTDVNEVSYIQCFSRIDCRDFSTTARDS